MLVLTSRRVESFQSYLQIILYLRKKVQTLFSFCLYEIHFTLWITAVLLLFTLSPGHTRGIQHTNQFSINLVQIELIANVIYNKVVSQFPWILNLLKQISRFQSSYFAFICVNVNPSCANYSWKLNRMLNRSECDLDLSQTCTKSSIFPNTQCKKKNNTMTSLGIKMKADTYLFFFFFLHTYELSWTTEVYWSVPRDRYESEDKTIYFFIVLATQKILSSQKKQNRLFDGCLFCNFYSQLTDR